MTDPPYSRESPQRPKYLTELQSANNSKLSWTGVPLMNVKMYVCKVGTLKSVHVLIQSSSSVIDFPNTDTDIINQLPKSRIVKNNKIEAILKIPHYDNETVKDFINRCANSEVNHGWDKSLLFLLDYN